LSQPPQQMGGQQTPAQMIQNILTQPRQNPGAMMGGGATPGLGPGIAGVATKFKGPSIKVYAERQKYEEWEFVFDPQKDGLMNRMPGAQQVQNPGNRPAGPQTPSRTPGVDRQ
jgi:hypothetical protein